MSLAEAIASLRDWKPSDPSHATPTEPPKATPYKAVSSALAAGGHGQTDGDGVRLALVPEGRPSLEDIAEFIAERSAIMEFDGGLDRTEARKAAGQRAAMKYRLSECYRDPPQSGGRCVIGGAGDCVEDVLRDLRERYGSRLIVAEAKESGSG